MILEKINKPNDIKQLSPISIFPKISVYSPLLTFIGALSCSSNVTFPEIVTLFPIVNKEQSLLVDKQLYILQRSPIWIPAFLYCSICNSILSLCFIFISTKYLNFL